MERTAMTLNEALPTRIVSLLRGNVSPVLLLGAGASVKSGVPLAGEMVERVARWGYCNDHGLHHADPSVMRLDWFRWLTRHAWYNAAASKHGETTIETNQDALRTGLRDVVRGHCN